MSRVVPSQIVKLIGRVGGSLTGEPGEALRRYDAPEIAAIVELASELPDELLVLSGDDYSHYRIGILSLIELLSFWKNNSSLPVSTVPFQALTGVAAIRILGNLLSKCPDESPSQSTAELLFISDDAFRESIRNDISAANRALHDGLWKAATVLAGAAAEALLRWAITDRKSSADIETARAAVIHSAPPDPDRWDLDGYIKVAGELGLIHTETAKQTDLAREFRNLIHPGRSARLAKVCDRGTALSALAAVELIVRDLS
jgi:hypothetical protein